MAKIGCLKPFRGSYNNIKDIVLEDGEIAFDTTYKRIYMGNGVHNIQNMNPFLSENYQLPQNINFNDYTTPGYYSTVNIGTPSNGPMSSNGYELGLLVLPMGVGETRFITQIAVTTTQSSHTLIFKRTKYDNVWDDWYSIDFSSAKYYSKIITDSSVDLNTYSKNGVFLMKNVNHLPNSTDWWIVENFVVPGYAMQLATRFASDRDLYFRKIYDSNHSWTVWLKSTFTPAT